MLLGCVSGISGKELLPIHARPITPKALISPSETFLNCGDDYYCITPKDLEELRVYMVPVQKDPSQSVIKKSVVARSGRGFHSKSRYKLSQLRNINERRYLDYLKKQNKTRCDNPDCTYCESPLIHAQSITEHQPTISDKEPRRSRYRFYGYTEDVPTIEVVPNRPRREVAFKNKIEEMIWRSKNN